MNDKELNTYLAILNKNMDVLNNSYNVKAIAIFGSTARREQKEGSDIDIIVEFSVPVGFFKFIRLEDFLAKILKNEVDLVSKKALKHTIKKQILKQAVYV